MRSEYVMKKRGRYWYYKLASEQTYHTTGAISRAKALEAIKHSVHEASRTALTIRDFSTGMFDEGSSYIKRRTAQGHPMSEKTRADHARALDRIIERFGAVRLDAFRPIDMESWLVELTYTTAGGNVKPFGNSMKNSIIDTMRLVLRDAHRKGHIAGMPVFDRFGRDSVRRGTLSAEELNRLFPDSIYELEAVWGKSDDESGAPLMFATLFYLMYSSGARPGEIRALSREQFIPALNGIIIDRQFNQAGVIAAPKKANPRDLRHRAIVIPERAADLLSRRISTLSAGEELVFTFHGRRIDRSYLSDRFRVGLKNASVKPGGRKLDAYSLRYTYNTRLQPVLPGAALRDFMGHRSEDMTDHYSRPHLIERLREYQSARLTVEAALYVSSSQTS